MNHRVELPSTAWPCRIRHAKGRTTPLLEVDPTSFQESINILKKLRYGGSMAGYVPPSDDTFADVLTGKPQSTASQADMQKLEIYNKWADLHPLTKQNLLRFEEKDFKLPAKAKGEVDVRILVSILSGIFRFPSN